MEGRTLSDLGHSQEPQFVSSDNRARPKVPRLEPSTVSWWWDILPHSFSPFASMFLKVLLTFPSELKGHATLFVLGMKNVPCNLGLEFLRWLNVLTYLRTMGLGL
jgi:hypothetical protein